MYAVNGKDMSHGAVDDGAQGKDGALAATFGHPFDEVNDAAALASDQSYEDLRGLCCARLIGLRQWLVVVVCIVGELPTNGRGEVSQHRK